MSVKINKIIIDTIWNIPLSASWCWWRFFIFCKSRKKKLGNTKYVGIYFMEHEQISFQSATRFLLFDMIWKINIWEKSDGWRTLGPCTNFSPSHLLPIDFGLFIKTSGDFAPGNSLLFLYCFLLSHIKNLLDCDRKI